MSTEVDESLTSVLERSRTLGFLGDGPLSPHIEQARAYLAALPSIGRAMDLGSGGGLPGLVLAREMPTVRWYLLDAIEKRCAFLRWAVRTLALDNCEVLEGRAEVLAHGPLRETFDAVVARSFGPPAAVAECAAGFIRLGGRAVISEPPNRPAGTRWDAPGLLGVGLTLGASLRTGRVTLQILERTHPIPTSMPRPAREMKRQPLFA